MTLAAKIQTELINAADKRYREFNSSLLPGTDNVLGVSIPKLRKFAKQLAKELTTEEWSTFVKDATPTYYEETMLQGMVISLTKMELQDRIPYVKMFIHRINNWAVCDIFCGELKTTVNKHKEYMWDFIQTYLKSDQEFELRFGIVMLLHYIDSEYIDHILIYSDTFRHEGYYAKMAMAWLLSICFVKFPEKTMNQLEQSNLDNWTYNKALQKIVESLRVDKATKEIIKSMKRK